MSNDSTSRVPAGVPTGGQFAASAKSESGVALGSAAPAKTVAEIGEMVAVSSLERGQRFIFSAEDGEADGGAILTVTGISNTFGIVEVSSEELDYDVDYSSPTAQVRRVTNDAVLANEVRTGDKVRLPDETDVWTVTSIDGDALDPSIEFDGDEETITSYNSDDVFILVED